MGSQSGYYTSRYLSENRDRLVKEANAKPQQTASAWHTIDTGRAYDTFVDNSSYNSRYDYNNDARTPSSPTYQGYGYSNNYNYNNNSNSQSPSSNYSNKLLPPRPPNLAPKTVKFSSQEQIQTYTREPSIQSSSVPSVRSPDYRDRHFNYRTGRVRNISDDNRYGLPSVEKNNDNNYGMPKEIILDVEDANDLKAEITPQELSLLQQGNYASGDAAPFAVIQSENDKSRYSGYYMNQKKRYDESQFIKPNQYTPKTFREVFIDETANSNKYNPIEVVFDSPEEPSNESVMKRTTRNVLNIFRSNKNDNRNNAANYKPKQDSSAKIVFLDDPDDYITDEEDEVVLVAPKTTEAPVVAPSAAPVLAPVETQTALAPAASIYSADALSTTNPVVSQPVVMPTTVFDNNAVQKPSKTSKFRRAMREKLSRAKHDLHQDHKEYMIRQAILEDQLDDEEKLAKVQEEEERMITAAISDENDKSDTRSISSGRSVRSTSSATSAKSNRSDKSATSAKSPKSAKSSMSTRTIKTSKSTSSKGSMTKLKDLKLKDGKKIVAEKVYKAGPNPEFSPAWNYLLSWITYEQPNLVEIKEGKEEGKDKDKWKKKEKVKEKDKEKDKIIEVVKSGDKVITETKETKEEEERRERLTHKMAKAILKPNVPSQYDYDSRKRYEVVRKNLTAIGRYWNEPVNRFGVKKGTITPKVRRRKSQRVLIEYPDGTSEEFVIDIPEGVEMSDEYITKYLQQLSATRSRYDPIDTMTPLSMGMGMRGAQVPIGGVIPPNGDIVEPIVDVGGTPVLSRSNSYGSVPPSPSIRSRKSSYSIYNPDPRVASIRSGTLNDSYYYTQPSWWPQIGSFGGGPAMIFSNIDQLIKSVKLFRVVFSPLDDILMSFPFPAVQALVVLVELLFLAFMAYELIILVDSVCMIIKSLCSPIIAIGLVLTTRKE
ncbi:uncharacterized protein KQ657_004678 [Scheffersomyces spartinae]|uniref:Uncharacterized protein n=1 Tax=Scheffersomyces spartinae TaxID=45513 RepID=A0A9P7VB00_9ASCO|nr:uncharacterized protein KQ657_004678 [Scheffersomyces spartinae]KAG7194465.1 hypothetical protein KQ657_004678 [Scheffersomyces spartinae]